MESMNKRFLSRAEAAEFLGLRPQTLANFSWQGQGPPFVRISLRCVRYDPDELMAWMKAREVRPN
jgi:predicted DNA-binding transcriptional regulator AlpA